MAGQRPPQSRRRPPLATRTPGPDPRADPERGSFLVATPEIIRPRGGDGDFAATWIGHSTVLLQLGGLNLITDPVFSQRAFPVQWLGPRRVMDPGLSIGELPPLDLVLLSHNHYDHLDRPAVKRIARNHPRATWVVPLGVRQYLRGWGVREILELDWWDRTSVGAVTVTATPARHFSARGLTDRNRSLWSGFAVEAAGRRVWFAGTRPITRSSARSGSGSGRSTW